MKAILAVDFGDVRTGFAKSDESGVLASPLAVFKTYPQKQLLEFVKKNIKEYSVGAIVLGVPYETGERVTIQTQKVLDFKKKLEKYVKIPVFETDESFSTSKAEELSHLAGKNRKKYKDMLDAYSAAVFLQEILDCMPQNILEVVREE